MEAILLHRSGKKPMPLKDSLLAENITLNNRLWNPTKQNLNSELLIAASVIVQGDYPDYAIIACIQELRERNSTVPIIFLDEVSNTHIQSRVMESGADAYFSMPLAPRQLARMCKKLIYKRESIIWMRPLKAYNLTLDVSRRLATRANRTIDLRNKEFALLEFLLMNRGRVIPRNTILEHVWDRNARFASNTLDVHINRLRRKLDDPFPQKLIHTVHSIGYRFDKE